MKKVSTGIAFLLAVLLGDAISEGLMHDGASVQYQRVDRMLVAGSGDNPWARPDPRQRRGQLPEYITNPRYATKEDIETKLNQDNRQQNTGGIPPQQQLQQQPGYGAGVGLPLIPNIYAPYSGMQYGYQPGYPAYPSYPGLGGLPGLGTPYMGNITGFGGNPLLTPYGNIYGNVVPYQQTTPPSGVR